MAAMAPSRTRGGVGRSQMPWPRLMPPARSHSRVIRRMSDWTRPSSLRAILIGMVSGSTIRRALLLGEWVLEAEKPPEKGAGGEEAVGDDHGSEQHEEGQGAGQSGSPRAGPDPFRSSISHVPGDGSLVDTTSCPSSSALRRMSGTAGR